MKLHVLFSSLGLVAGCTATEPTDSPLLELADQVSASNGPGCDNGIAAAGELCVGLPGALVIDTEDQVHTVLAVDLDADGDRDLVAMTRQRVWIRYAVPGGFGALAWWSTAGAQYMDVAAGDFDADGDLDLAIADDGTDQVLIRRNDGGFTFPVTGQIPVGRSPTRILAARLDANTRTDLVVLETGAGAALVLLSNGAGFAQAVRYAVGDAPDIALGDCDASGSLDLLYVNGQGTSATLRARRNSGGLLAAPLASALPLYDAELGYLYDLAIVSTDLDGDGRADAVVSTSHSQLPSATSDGGCTFTPAYTPATLSNTYAWSYRLRATDWDVDGRSDIAAAHGLLGAPLAQDHWSVVFGDGTGAFASGDSVAEVPGIGARDLAFLDADGDGDRDVALGGFHGVVLELNEP
jgi:FG-GAP-like repeat